MPQQLFRIQVLCGRSGSYADDGTDTDPRMAVEYAGERAV